MWCKSVEDIAGPFGVNKVSNALRSIEALGTMQTRHWNVATLNKLRAFMGLTKQATFKDINPDPAVVMGQKSVYDSPRRSRHKTGCPPQPIAPIQTHETDHLHNNRALYIHFLSPTH